MAACCAALPPLPSKVFLNRTVAWDFRLDGRDRLHRVSDIGCMDSFLNNPNLLMLLVNQHNNITHEKVISLPLGVNDPAALMSVGRKLAATDRKKSILLFSAGSDYGNNNL